MTVFNKIQTLLRAGARESAELITDANAVRIYRQEVVDAQNLLSRRRIGLASIIATRKDLEQEIARSEERIAAREAQVSGLPRQQLTDDLLLLAAKDIADNERLLEHLRRRHLGLVERIQKEELLLRRLAGDIREHDREARLLHSQLSLGRAGSTLRCQNTVAGQLETLRGTRDTIDKMVLNCDLAEDSYQEALDRVDGDPLQAALEERGCGEENLRLNAVLSRLKAQATDS